MRYATIYANGRTAAGIVFGSGSIQYSCETRTINETHKLFPLAVLWNEIAIPWPQLGYISEGLLFKELKSK